MGLDLHFKRVLLLNPHPPKPQLKRFNPSTLFSSSSSSSSSSSDPSSSPSNLSISTVVSVLIHHRSKSRWRYLNSLCRNGFSPDEFSQITLHVKNNPHLALRFFQWTHKKSLCNHNLLSYSTLIHVLARSRLKSEALNLIKTAIRATKLKNNEEEGEESESSPLKLFETLVKTYKQCGSAPFVFDLLIRALLDSKKIDPAIEIVRMLRSRGISPQIGTLNSLISEVSRCQGANQGYEIYREVFRPFDEDYEIKNGNVKRVFVNVSPNVHTFNALMVCFYQHGNFEKVKEIWNQMGESNSVPNCYSYSILMEAFCVEGRMEEAEELWEEMRGKNIEPDITAYNTMINGFCQNGEVVKGEELFRELELSGIESTLTTLGHLINGYFKIGDVESALLVYKDMCRNKDFRYNDNNPLVLEGLVRGLCVKKRVLEGLEVFRGSSDPVCSDFHPTRKSYELLVKGLCEEGKVEEALELQVEMVGKGFRPDFETYSAFIDCYMKQGNDEMVEKLRNEMLEAQIN